MGLGDDDFDEVKSDPKYPLLATAGYLTVTPVKNHVWNISLTDLGKQSIDGNPYAHEQKADCDQWQVTIPLAKYDHVDVTGIVEEGVRAKAGVLISFVLTPAGLVANKTARDVVYEVDRKRLNEEMANRFRDEGISVSRLLGKDIASLPRNATKYSGQTTVTFEKYDDGWRVSNH